MGLIGMAIATVLQNEGLLGFGTGLFIDDRIYHSVRDYAQLKRSGMRSLNEVVCEA
ncbi:MAG: hypothetical protein QMC78_01485 [Methanocellales archaeon]|nr:hypothetical protein [Methanocellales archaeon]